MSLRNQASQDVSVSVTFISGNFEQGFRVRVRLLDSQGGEMDKISPRPIPAAPEIRDYYREWQNAYGSLSTRRIEVPPQEIERSVVVDCRQAAEQLQDYLVETWFHEPVFEFFQAWIDGRTQVKEDQSVPVVFEFETGDTEQDSVLKRLPWNSWSLFRKQSNLEPTLTNLCFETVQPLSHKLSILAIYGSDEGGLKLEDDDAAIQEVEAAGATVTRVYQPSREELHNLLTDRTQSWDMLFFAGHSFSNANLSAAWIQFGPGESGICRDRDLYNDLDSAVKRGLKIAIFNSCDGLGIADYLSKELKIPCVLAFKEAVPDKVAREFLKEFLKEFTHGTPLYLSVRRARNNITWMESDEKDPYPGASWLPVVTQHPRQPEFVWSGAKSPPRRPSRRRLYLTLGVVGFLLAVLSPFLLKLLSPAPPAKSTLYPNVVRSYGQTELFESQSLLKDNGIRAMGQFPPAYGKAIDEFVLSLQGASNDPESWIYLNNAIASNTKSLEVVDIATALPMHNEAASLEVLRGVAQAQSEFNCDSVDAVVNAVEQRNQPKCNGTNGKMLRVQIAGSNESNLNTNTNALETAQYITSQDGILAVIGHFSSTASLQAAPQYAASSMVAISPISTSVELTQYRNFYRTPPSDALAAEILASYALNSLGIDKVALAHVPGSSFSESFADEFRTNLPGATFVYEEGECDLNKGLNMEAEKCIGSAIENGAKAILLVPNSTDFTLVTALRLAEVDQDIVFLGADSLYNGRTLETFEGLSNQVFISVAWHRSDSAFEQDAIALYGSQVNWRSAMAYDAVQAISGVLQQIPSNLTREEFLKQFDALRKTSIENGAAAPIWFDDNGDRLLIPGQTDGTLGVLVTIDPEEGFVQVNSD